MENYTKTAIPLFVSLLLPGLVWAQTQPDAGVLQQQMDRQRQAPLPPRAAPQKAAPPVEMARREGVIVTVKAFRFAGNTLLTAEQIEPALVEYLKRPLDYALLQEVAAVVANVFREAGWIVQAYLPVQDVTDGVVTIQIVEAVFGGVQLNGAPPKRVPLARVLELLDAQLSRDKPLNADAVDRALLLADDLVGVVVAGGLREGEKQSATQMDLKMVDEPLVIGEVSYANTGSRSTGPEQVSLNANLNSPLGKADLFSFSLMHSAGSDFARLAATFPLGNDGWKIGGSVSHLTYHLVAPEFKPLQAKGSSDTSGLEASYPIIRSRSGNLYFTANLDRKAFDNESSGATTTRYKAETATLGLNGNYFDSLGGGGANTASMGWVNGNIDLDGSPNRTADAASTRTEGSFSKLRYAVNRQQTITSKLALYAAYSGQVASKNLDSSERFYLGGFSGIRAYPSSEGGGSEGEMFNLELRWKLPEGFNLTGFYDYGRVKVNRNNDYVGAPALNKLSLKGAGLAFSWLSKEGLAIKTIWSRRIGENPNPTATGYDQDGSLRKDRFWLTLSQQF
jgi:hemolysin activation/secretion protein